jgi:hypothetical protein
MTLARAFSMTILMKGQAMTYRIYSGPRGARLESPLDKSKLLYKEVDTLDAAMSWARHLNEGGRVALMIEGDDGTSLSKQEIAGALKHPEDRRLSRAS